MKTLTSILQNTDWLPKCSPEKEIRCVEGNYLPFAIPASDACCPKCFGKDGYYIPANQSWYCRTCLFQEIENKSKANHKFELPKKEELILKKSYNNVLKCDQDKNIINFFCEFVLEPKGFIVLSGKNGTGKTYLAQSAINDCKCNGYESSMLSQSEINHRWNQNIQDFGSSDFYLNILQEYKVLAIDDLGTRTPTEAFMDALYFIIDNRWRNNRATIITTNLTSPEVRQKFGDAFLSRIASGKCFRFETEDRRKVDF